MSNPAARRPLTTRFYDGLKGGLQSLDRFSRMHDRSVLDDRRQRSNTLVCVPAGYKPELWPFVMPRLRLALPDADVCVVSPGLRLDSLAELCRSEGWSYLSTATNDVALAQNVCYRLHPDASMIVKLDEDMFLLPATISTLLTEYQSIRRQGAVDPRLCRSNDSVKRLLLSTSARNAGAARRVQEARFGSARMATSGIAIQTDPAAALWIWEKTSPLITTAERLAIRGTRRLLCPIQFSIGLIVFERAFWEEIGFLPVYRHRLLTGIGTLGGDEAYICGQALEKSRPGVVTTATCAGHFSFGPQYTAMKSLLDVHSEIFQR